MAVAMTYGPDLTEYSYGPDSEDKALNVGWLSASHPFPSGEAPPNVVPAILYLVLEQPAKRSRGWHRCEICDDPDYPIRMEVDGKYVALGDAEIRVGSDDSTVYAAPSLVAHYIGEHS